MIYKGAEHRNICRMINPMCIRGVAHRNNEIQLLKISRCAAPFNSLIVVISTNILRLCRFWELKSNAFNPIKVIHNFCC